MTNIEGEEKTVGGGESVRTERLEQREGVREQEIAVRYLRSKRERARDRGSV